MKSISELLNDSKTSFQAVKEAEAILQENGFMCLYENEVYAISAGGKYYVTRNDSALIAFVTASAKQTGYRIVASHTDSPCFKVKFGKNPVSAGCATAYVEQYGGGLRYTWFDCPLKLCGRLCGEKDGRFVSVFYESEKRFVIPSLAIHYNRSANDGIPFNVQTDCQPLYALDTDAEALKKDLIAAFDGKLLDCDLYLVCDETPFTAGRNDEFLCAPRVDNLTSCFSSVQALIDCKPHENNTVVAYLADNEEIGSRTKQGAGSTFLFDTLKRINEKVSDLSLEINLKNTFLVSCDNAHATHPCHASLADGSNEVTLGSGIVIKHHGNMNYTTDAVSSSLFKMLLNSADVPYSDFYMRSDLPCGGTLGAISSSQVSVISVDIGIAQLAMHSAVETFAIKDYYSMVKGLTAFYSSALLPTNL